MDWQGQKLAEQIMQVMLLVFAVVSFGAGYVLGSFQMMMLVYAGGVTLTALITIPNWPFFNRHPLKWLDPSEAEKHPKPQVAVSSKKKSSKK
ncbi:hypothetical protein Goshw_013587 [Gossypium schwendimanii]|uniref:Signal peptidase complex subunit 1 n=16 Tax=Gossypium TaxID=3633 RepID=A0A0D2NQ53_GOSRA|nr:signal peptidase complex subunit 1 [Gossypium raimondii]XP_016706195.1 probable signal peptidase complex subunit 1 [Gossypium hirsutum]XP_052489874.1 signal peptidase complex subunit 1 [Gossypium raimondii]KAB2045782.1 hypothetical protein ES319_D01G185500v1 [Gossypium barbadense]MBA0551004.1 hypothetical protein [Gossypium lobatum]MBA0607583.1 hypothetical protein [Gossypium davidsonii]MBA0642581.1 hypothetical protein [Gossypium klotzschianum]MBA0700385.1 hypothetical protein [Gossypium